MRSFNWRHTGERAAKNSARKAVDEWLDGKRSESTGGYSPVTHQDTDDLYGMIMWLISARFELDPDADLPIEVDIVNRTRFHRSHYRAVPYTHADPLEEREKYDQELEDARDLSELNVSLAWEAYKRIMDEAKLTRRERSEEDKE